MNVARLPQGHTCVCVVNRLEYMCYFGTAQLAVTETIGQYARNLDVRVTFEKEDEQVSKLRATRDYLCWRQTICTCLVG